MVRKGGGAQRAFYYKSNKLLQIRGFIAVVNYGTVTEAAKMLNLTQSTVSEQINSLQQELGVKLFRKSGRLLELTEDGRQLYELVVPLWQGIDSVYDTFLEKLSEDKMSSLKIAGHHSVFSLFLPKYLKMVYNEKMKIDLLYISKEDSFEQLIRGEVDLAIYPMEEGEIIPKNIDFFKAFQYESSLIVPKGHKLEKIPDKDLKIEHIGGYNFLHPGNCSLSKIMQMHIGAQNFKADIQIKNGNWEALKELVRHGMGITFFHRGYLNDRDLEDITPKDISHLMPKMFYGVMFLKNGHLNAAAKDIIDLMMKDC